MSPRLPETSLNASGFSSLLLVIYSLSRAWKPPRPWGTRWRLSLGIQQFPTKLDQWFSGSFRAVKAVSCVWEDRAAVSESGFGGPTPDVIRQRAVHISDSKSRGDARARVAAALSKMLFSVGSQTEPRMKEGKWQNLVALPRLPRREYWS